MRTRPERTTRSKRKLSLLGGRFCSGKIEHAIALRGRPTERFAGMVRAIFEKEMDVLWEDVFD